jgi:hypothetical protein
MFASFYGIWQNVHFSYLIKLGQNNSTVDLTRHDTNHKGTGKNIDFENNRQNYTL